jgi:hypothetical protein
LAFQQEINFILAADEISHLRQPDSLEAALSIRYALNRPRGDRIGNTLDLVPAEVPQTEQIADRARGAGNNDRPGSAKA